MNTIPKQPDSFSLPVAGKPRSYQIRELDPGFVAWNLGQRTGVLRKMLETAESGQPLPHGKGGGGFGAHLPVYITSNPAESLFPANAANKGTGFVAKAEYLDYYIDKFRRTKEETELPSDASESERTAAVRQRISAILDFYDDTDKIDLTCLAGLEIWPGHTTKNFEADPRVSLHFLGMPTPGTTRYQQWQVNCIWQKLPPGDQRYDFGVALRGLTMGHVGRSFVPGHIPAEQTPIRGTYPNGWTLWVVETLDKGIDALAG